MISELEALPMEMVWSQGIDKKDWKKKITNKRLTYLELESQKEDRLGQKEILGWQWLLFSNLITNWTYTWRSTHFSRH